MSGGGRPCARGRRPLSHSGGAAVLPRDSSSPPPWRSPPGCLCPPAASPAGRGGPHGRRNESNLSMKWPNTDRQPLGPGAKPSPSDRPLRTAQTSCPPATPASRATPSGGGDQASGVVGGPPAPQSDAKAAQREAEAPAAKPTKAARWVRFELVAPDAQSVFLAGTFNDWNAKATRMVRLHDGRWAKELRLPAGRHEYLFVVDGQWTPDPKAKERAPHPFGGCNCVVEV